MKDILIILQKEYKNKQDDDTIIIWKSMQAQLIKRWWFTSLTLTMNNVKREV